MVGRGGLGARGEGGRGAEGQADGCQKHRLGTGPRHRKPWRGCCVSALPVVCHLTSKATFAPTPAALKGCMASPTANHGRVECQACSQECGWAFLCRPLWCGNQSLTQRHRSSAEGSCLVAAWGSSVVAMDRGGGRVGCFQHLFQGGSNMKASRAVLLSRSGEEGRAQAQIKGLAWAIRRLQTGSIKGAYGQVSTGHAFGASRKAT